MLEVMGLRLGSIGLYCMAFLFLPISRGSVLLRLIDIPFEHATRYHVWLGHLTMVLFSLHGLFYVIACAMDGRLIEEVSLLNNISLFHYLDIRKIWCRYRGLLSHISFFVFHLFLNLTN